MPGEKNGNAVVPEIIGGTPEVVASQSSRVGPIQNAKVVVHL